MIKICKFNSYYEEIDEYLTKNYIHFSVEECLGRCDLCHSGAFIQKDDEFIFAATGTDLILQLEFIIR